MSTYKDMGYMNGWEKDSKNFDIIKECNHAMHPREHKKIGRSVKQTICHICKYIYKVDSGD